MTRRRGQFADFGIQSHRRLDTSCAGRAVDGQIFDHRETVMGLHWLARTDLEGMRAGQFAHVGYPVMPMLVRMLAREVDATDS
jgi:hypothetical protein